MIELILGCLIVGAVVGVLAGLFGIGGGLVIVPCLLYLLPLGGVPEAYLMSVALGTSFASIIITAFSSARRHHQLGNVDWTAAKFLIPSLMVSIFLAGLVIGKLDKGFMTKLFSVMVVFLAGKMLLSAQQKQEKGDKALTPKETLVAGSVIGVLSSMAGIGGGSFIVPFLNARGIEMKRAIGTSSLCGIFLAAAASLSFIWSGWQLEGLPAGSLGFVYVPALIGLTATSFFTTKIGANLANRLPVKTLKKAFACLLIVIALNLFLNH